MRISADVAELVDALASGASALRGVEVQVLSSVPPSSYPNPPQSKQAEMWFQMLNNAHPPGWALFVLWSSWTCRRLEVVRVHSAQALTVVACSQMKDVKI